MPESPPPPSKRRRIRLGAVSRPAGQAEVPKRAGVTRREELLDIAAELLAERSFASVTVDDLGAAAGISGPALYHHFDSKEALLGEMLVDISQHLFDGGRGLRDTSPPERLLDDLIEMHVDFAVDHRALISVHFRDLLQASATDQRRVRVLQRQYVEIWVDALLVRKPTLTAAIARPAVHGVLGLINSTPFSPRARRGDMVALLRTMAAASFAAVGVTDAPIA
ncbi:TetR/AcrR family transcriptional regulator [Desertimonas flava]|uniref:TetR/AcrR family transcriptional regulator n=1 Tax=Desertimonas flava TaxID=2064846 RepID=UPI000E357E9B|nr:TetR/AcrR family transcriptional regulator [Desertimonas flava]